MCGEIDEGLQIDDEIFQRFLQIAKNHGAVPRSGTNTLPDLEEAAGRSAYMETIFGAGLTRSLSDASAAQEGQRIDAIAAQAIAFARLAGFLAGQLPAEADLFRSTIEAITDGHAMPRRTADKIRHGHDHHHGRHGRRRKRGNLKCSNDPNLGDKWLPCSNGAYWLRCLACGNQHNRAGNSGHRRICRGENHEHRQQRVASLHPDNRNVRNVFRLGWYMAVQQVSGWQRRHGLTTRRHLHGD